MSVLSDRRKRRIFLLYVTTHACAGASTYNFIHFFSIRQSHRFGRTCAAGFNSNNTNWISFKLGAERTLGMANMYAHLFSVRFKKWRHGGHICFLTAMITL